MHQAYTGRAPADAPGRGGGGVNGVREAGCNGRAVGGPEGDQAAGGVAALRWVGRRDAGRPTGLR